MKTALREPNQLRLMVRTHSGISQTVCPLCGHPNALLKTGTGLYDGPVHLGDVCHSCLRGGKRGAAARTRSFLSELRRLTLAGMSEPHQTAEEQYLAWLARYADFLENLAGRIEQMTEWIPRPQ